MRNIERLRSNKGKTANVKSGSVRTNTSVAANGSLSVFRILQDALDVKNRMDGNDVSESQRSYSLLGVRNRDADRELTAQCLSDSFQCGYGGIGGAAFDL